MSDYDDYSDDNIETFDNVSDDDDYITVDNEDVGFSSN